MDKNLIKYLTKKKAQETLRIHALEYNSVKNSTEGKDIK